jgi:hypothetical protein
VCFVAIKLTSGRHRTTQGRVGTETMRASRAPIITMGFGWTQYRRNIPHRAIFTARHDLVCFMCWKMRETGLALYMECREVTPARHGNPALPNAQ